MAWRIVKQPNGLLGLFSDVVDHFTYYNMTEDEAIEVCKSDYDLGRQSSKDKVQRGVADDSLERWADSIERIEAIYGVEEVNKFKKEIECQK